MKFVDTLKWLFAAWDFYNGHKILVNKALQIGMDLDAIDDGQIFAKINAVFVKNGIDFSKLAQLAQADAPAPQPSTDGPVVKLPTDNGLPINDPDHLD